MIIENMTSAHVSQIAELEKLCFSDPWSEKSIATELSCRRSVWLVALEDDRVVGYVGSQTVCDETDMMNIAVHPDYRRQKLGTALITDLMDALAKRGSHSLTLEVRASNHTAIMLYGSRGFRSVGRRKNYYEHPKEDAIIMTREFKHAETETADA